MTSVGEAPHECLGENCPYLVDTGEAMVCSITGICVGSAFVASFDYLSTSTKEKSHNINASMIYKTAVALPADTIKPEACRREEIFSTCYRVVESLLIKNQKDDINKDKNIKCNASAMKTALKAAHRVLKNPCKSKSSLMSSVFECVHVYQKNRQTGSRQFCKTKLNNVVQRCVACCLLCLSSPVGSVKVNPQDICIAFLYLMRLGVQVNGVAVIKKDENVANALPKLNVIDSFQFSKSKFTKAERFIRNKLQQALLTRPLHALKL